MNDRLHISNEQSPPYALVHKFGTMSDGYDGGRQLDSTDWPSSSPGMGPYCLGL